MSWFLIYHLLFNSEQTLHCNDTGLRVSNAFWRSCRVPSPPFDVLSQQTLTQKMIQAWEPFLNFGGVVDLNVYHLVLSPLQNSYKIKAKVSILHSGVAQFFFLPFAFQFSAVFTLYWIWLEYLFGILTDLASMIPSIWPNRVTQHIRWWSFTT